VFAALYDATGTRIIIEASALAPDETLAHWSRESLSAAMRFIGDGAVRYADIIRDRLGPDAAIVRETPPLAGTIGQMASRSPERAVLPHAVVPIYIRRPDAELARSRRR
jgi:tRNA A37 threonylcarbamoyladenosine modification protein TsaB